CHLGAHDDPPPAPPRVRPSRAAGPSRRPGAGSAVPLAAAPPPWAAADGAVSIRPPTRAVFHRPAWRRARAAGRRRVHDRGDPRCRLHRVAPGRGHDRDGSLRSPHAAMTTWRPLKVTSTSADPIGDMAVKKRLAETAPEDGMDDTTTPRVRSEAVARGR